MKRPMALSSLAVVATILLMSSCNRRVFERVENTCLKTVATDIPVPTDKAADILIVVDNSGSMAEEQQNLVENFLNQNAAECPLQDLANIPTEYKNPVRSLYTSGGTLSRCGFIQLLAAFENDFRVGVITTDVGLCDNRLPDSQGGAAWGFRPQRGCLQPDSAPGGSGRKLIAAADLVDGDGANDDFAQRFRSTLENIRTFGSPFERGLDAVDLFLTAAADQRAPGCEGDLQTFRRDDAALVVIFLTDEEDCSHGKGGKLEVFGNENAGEVCGEFIEHFTNVDTKKCYSNPEDLSAVSDYVDALLAADENAKVAVIAGGVGDAGSIEPSGCLVGATGLPEGGDTDGDGDNDICFESGGLSNFNDTGPNNPCGPDTADQRGGLDCCVADAGSRYYQYAQQIGNAATDSICNASFRSTMLDIAAFIAAVDQVALAEPPANPSAVIVEITRAGSTEQEKVDALPAGADCATSDGYQLVDERFIQLCGSARPGPGDTISVRAAGQASEECLAAQ